MTKKKQASVMSTMHGPSLQESYLHIALENMLEGFQIVDREWRYLYVNEAAARHGEKKAAELLGQKMIEVYPGIERTAIFQTLSQCMDGGIPATITNEFVYEDGHGRWFELYISPVPDGLCIFSLDVTNRKRAESRVQNLGRLLTMLSNINRCIVRVRDLQTFLDNACRIAVEDGRFSLAWIGLLDDAGQKLCIVAQAGDATDYFQHFDTHYGQDKHPRCPVENVLHDGQYNICLMTQSSHRDLAPCQASAFEHGFRSSASFPLYVHHKIRGVFNLYITEPDFFDGDEVELLKDFTADIGFAIEVAEGEQERVRAEDAVSQYARRLEDAGMYAHLGSWEFNVCTGQGWWSREMYRMFGIEERDTVPNFEEYLDLVHPEDRPRVREVLDQVLHGKETSPREFRTHPTLGPVRSLTLTVYALRDDFDGQMTKIIGIQVDSTERKQDRDILLESEARYRSLFEDSPISLWEEDFSAVKTKLDALRWEGVTDFKAYFSAHPEVVAEFVRLVRITDVNKATLELYKVGEKSELLTSLDHIFRGEPMQQFQEELCMLAEGRTSFDWEGLNYTVDGRLLHINLRWAAVPGHEIDLSKVIVSIIDITDRKLAENALRASENNYRTLVEQIPAIVYIDSITNGKSEAVFISPQLENILGIKPSDWLRHSVEIWLDHLHPEDRERANQVYRDFLREGGTYDCEYRMLREDGRMVWLHDQAVLVEGHDSQPPRMHGVLYDITARKQAEHDLRQRLRELETLHTVSSALRAAQTLEEILPQLLDETLTSLETDSGEIMLYDPASNELRTSVTRGWYGQIESSRIKPGQGISGQVLSSGKPHWSVDLSQDPAVLPSMRDFIPSGWGGGCVPILAGKDVVGVILVSMQLPRQATLEQMHLLESLAEIAGAAVHRIRLHEETVRRLQNLQALHEVDLAVASNFDLRPTLDTVIGHAIHQLGVDVVDILLLRPHLNKLEYAAGQGFRTRFNRDASVRVGEGFAGRVALERRPLYMSDPTDVQMSRTFATFWNEEGFRSYFCVPLIAKGDIKGVLEVFNRTLLPSNPDWLYYLETLAGQAAIAIDNTQLFENLQQANMELGVAYEATIEGWSRALDLRDEETEGHTERVTDMALALAANFKFTPFEMMSIRRGAILHDIGKMGVPDTILRKQGPLTEEEWTVMRRHPQLAYDMLKPIHYLRDSLDIPYCHHEKWDGTGYPRGLAGENIPLAARIFSVVDVYDALTNHRPYRRAWSVDKTLDYIREESGRYFDPRVVEAFLRKFLQR